MNPVCSTKRNGWKMIVHDVRCNQGFVASSVGFSTHVGMRRQYDACVISARLVEVIKKTYERH